MTASKESDALGALVRDRLVVVADGGDARSVAHLQRLGARGVLVLGPAGTDEAGTARYVSSARVGANNCSVAVLNNRAAFALRSRKFFRGFEIILVPLNLSQISGGIGLVRYLARRQLAPMGRVWLDGFAVPLLAFRNTGFDNRPRHRIYAPRAMTPLGILQAIGDLDAVALRWVEMVEEGEAVADLDLLVRGSAAEALEQRLSREIGTFPVDLYTDDGSGKRLFKDVPYYPPSMAQRVLDSASVRDSGARVPSPLWRFVSYAFHLLFHKSNRLGVATDSLTPAAFGDERYVRELWRLADAAGEPRPQSVGDIEEMLRRHDAFPELDTIGFYSTGNAFLAARYVAGHAEMEPGLGVFVLRDFGLPSGIVEDVRGRLRSSGFELLAETPLDRNSAAVTRIRGGNWIDDQAPGKVALPVHAFVCLDPRPVTPAGADRRRYPRLDNANMLLKAVLRSEFAGLGEKSKLNFIHASDNSAEAKVYAEVLGLAGEPEVAAAIARLSAPRTQ